MKPAARIETVTELLKQLLEIPSPADNLIMIYFRKNRFIGASDRREIVQLLYGILRDLKKIFWFIQQVTPPEFLTLENQARFCVLTYLLLSEKMSISRLLEIYDGQKYNPSPLTNLEKKTLEGIQALDRQKIPAHVSLGITEELWPYFYESFFEDLEFEIQALNQSASFDLRINPLKTKREDVLKNLLDDQIPAIPTPFSPVGIRLFRRRPLRSHFLWKQGLIEVQDEGSQLVALLVEAKPGMAVLDLCAGAGGKTLMLAAQMQNKGRLIASDVIDWRLRKSKERLKRAGVQNAEMRLLDAAGRSWLKRQEQRFDRVLVDAPCSGTGTWRRNPDLKWRFSLKDLQELIQKQQDILRGAAPLVKINGRLIYATCSLLKVENHHQRDTFLKEHPHFREVPVSKVWQSVLHSSCPTASPVLQLTPAQQGTDGFFVAIFERIS